MFDYRTNMSDYVLMTGKEFIKKVKAPGKANGVEVRLLKNRGKGSHQMLHYGDRKTTVRNPKDELKTGTRNAMRKQLGIKEFELNS